MLDAAVVGGGLDYGSGLRFGSVGVEGEHVEVHLRGEAFALVLGRDPAGEGVEVFWFFFGC